MLFEDIYHNWYPLTPGEYARVYQQFNRRYADMARELNVPFADVAAEFPKDPRYFAFDYYHFNPEGNKLLAAYFARSLTTDVLPKLIAKQS